MKPLLLLALFIPTQSVPEPIIVSPEERVAIIQKFQEMQDHIDKLERALKICTRVQQS